MICIEILETGQRRKLDAPVWIRGNRNGPVRTPHRVKAQGVCDGETIWALEGKGLEGYGTARIITRAEYEESLAPQEADPELTDTEALNIMMGGTYETE